MSRRVLQTVLLDVGDAVYEVPPGVTVATLLPLTNMEATGYAEYRPDRWKGRQLADVSGLAARALR